MTHLQRNSQEVDLNGKIVSHQELQQILHAKNDAEQLSCSLKIPTLQEEL